MRNPTSPLTPPRKRRGAKAFILMLAVMLLAGCRPAGELLTTPPTPTMEAPTPTLTFTENGEWNVNCLEIEQQDMVINQNPCLSLAVVKSIGDFVYLEPARMTVIPRPNDAGEVGINMKYTAGISYYIGQGAPGKAWSGRVSTFTNQFEVKDNVCYLGFILFYSDIWSIEVDHNNVKLAEGYAVNLVLHVDDTLDGHEVALNEQGLYEIIENPFDVDYFDMTGERERMFPFWTRNYGSSVLPELVFIGRHGLATPESTFTLQAFAIFETHDAGGAGLCQRIEAF